MDRARPIRLRFGPFEADLARRELYENGEIVHIQGKPFQFLASLLRQNGEIVSREAISHALWPDIYVQVNQGLNAAARKVRMALNDDALKPIYIETLGSRGYRFIHPTEVVRWSSELAELPDSPVRMAVLPLKFESAEDTALAGGITRELVSTLARMHPRLTVLPIGDVARHAGSNGHFEALRKAMNIQHVLSGALKTRAGRLEIGLMMESLPGGERLWEERYEGASQNLGQIQESIAERVLSTFRNLSAVTPAPQFRTKASVYREFLTGRHHQARQTLLEAREALARFKKATELDPQFAPGFLGMAETFNVIGVRGWMLPKSAYAQAHQAAKRVLELDPSNADAMNALGWSQLAGHRDWALATRLFERGLQANPNSTLGYCYYSYVLFTRGRADDGVASLEKARHIDPTSLFINNRLTAMYYFARRYDEAIAQARATLSLAPDCSYTRTYLGLSFLAQRKHSEALDQLEAAVKHSQEDPVAVAQLAYAQAQAGRFQVAEALLQKLQSNGHSTLPSYHIALIKLALGNVNEAFQWLDTAYEHCWHWVLLIPHDPRLDILRGTRRFETLCRSMRPVEVQKIAN